MAELARHIVEFGEAVFDQREPPARRLHETRAVRDRRAVAVDRDHRCVGRGENGARVTARAKGAVDIDAAVAHPELLDHRMNEHGNMTGQSASDI